MRVIHTQHVTHGAGRFLVLRIRAQPQFRHRIDDASLHRLQAIGNMRQGAIENDVHGIVQVRLLGEILERELFVGSDVHGKFSADESWGGRSAPESMEF